MNEITKKDWKLFCDKVPEWQERHMDSLLREYVALINSPGDASAHFWELVKRIKQDKKRDSYLKDISAVVASKAGEIIGSYGCAGFDTFGPFKLVGGLQKGHPDEDEIAGAVKFFEGLK